jgi:hypothetical protein
MNVVFEWVVVIVVMGFIGLLFWAIGGIGMSALGLGDKRDADADTMYSNNYSLYPHSSPSAGPGRRRGRSAP